MEMKLESFINIRMSKNEVEEIYSFLEDTIILTECGNTLKTLYNTLKTFTAVTK